MACAMAPAAMADQINSMTEMLKISLPDGSVREMPAGSTPADVAAAIGPGLAKAALAARVDGELRDLARPFDGDAELALVTARDEADALELARHDYAHVLAEAVQALWPGTQITFGPSTDDGFYYDFAPGLRAGRSPTRTCPRSRRRCARSSPPTSRCAARCGAATQLIARWRPQGESFKAEWAARTARRRGADGLLVGRRLARHVPRAAPCLAPASSIRRRSS